MCPRGRVGRSGRCLGRRLGTRAWGEAMVGHRSVLAGWVIELLLFGRVIFVESAQAFVQGFGNGSKESILLVKRFLFLTSR